MARSALLGKVRSGIRVRHYSLRTEQAYIHWLRRFILFHNKRHPDGMGEPEITAFLSDLAVNRNVSASTQNQALSAILFLYQKVLDRKLEWLDDIVRAKRPQHLPVILTRDETRQPLDDIPGTNGLIAPEGAGHRLRLPADNDSFWQRRQGPGNNAACRAD
jgi:site-specific recombinase XerD